MSTPDHGSQWAAIRSVGEKLGCSTEALRRASWKAIAAAVLKAAPVESVSRYEPSWTSTRTSTIGYPFSTPFAIDSLMPISTDGMKRFGIVPPIVVSSMLCLHQELALQAIDDAFEVCLAGGPDHGTAPCYARRYPQFGVLDFEYLEGAREPLLISRRSRRNVERKQNSSKGFLVQELPPNAEATK